MNAAGDYTDWAGQEIPDSDASVFIQWKGTDVCMDFRCPCGAHCHIDDDFTYSVQCPSCSTIYELGTQVRVRRVEASFSEPRVMEAL